MELAGDQVALISVRVTDHQQAMRGLPAAILAQQSLQSALGGIDLAAVEVQFGQRFERLCEQISERSTFRCPPVRGVIAIE